MDDVHLFGVRHHSPAAARLVRALIATVRPATVLVEGPSDFTRMEELALDHQLPIAIYSSVLTELGRAAAYHPFCLHSPEWEALRAGRAVGARTAFIDLPWAAMAADAEVAHRYADHELRRSPRIPELCARLGVEDLDAAWDTLFEVDPDLDLTTYTQRCEALCAELRGTGEVPELDQRREAFMAARIREARAPVVVVCGGFHVEGLRALLAGAPVPAETPAAAVDGDGRVSALTPYSFAALDALTGYEAGMPNPGFYDAVWRARTIRGSPPPAEAMLARIVAALRARDVPVSPADLIAVESTSAALARLRGHAEVWRTDLLDGILGGLVKDELEAGLTHPMLEAAHAVLRGGARGRLADGVLRPPFVHDLERSLAAAGLAPGPRPRTVDLDLADTDLDRSRLLHRLRALELPGFVPEDVVRRPASDALLERWRILADIGLEGAAVEAAGYGVSVAAAAAGRLLERVAGLERDAGTAAAVLEEVALCGLDDVAGPLLTRTRALIARDPDLASVTAALATTLHLYRYEPVLGSAGGVRYGELVDAAYDRVLWLIDPGGGVRVAEDAAVGAIAGALECFERCGRALDLARGQLVGVLERVEADPAAAPGARGAALGALWQLDVAGEAALRAAPLRFGDPATLGDFLHGLFALAREAVQRRPDLVRQVDLVLAGFTDEDFLDAVPALRRAFSAFTPREKDNLARVVLGRDGASARTAGDPETLAAMLALEGELRTRLERYGVGA